MTRFLRTALSLLALLACVIAVPLLAAPSADAAPANAKLIESGDFPDPGFAHFGSTYYTYATGPGFRVSSSTALTGPYSTPKASMPAIPSWVGTASDGGHHLWAPDVFSVTGPNGNPLYVMSFTGYNKQDGWNANCVGVATSVYPDRNFQAVGGPICALYSDHEAIDPSAFRDPKTGKRWIVFKTNIGNRSDFRIQAIQMDQYGVHKVVNTRRTLVSSASSRMEAPSLITHGGKVWLFLARADYVDCSYYTDARSTASFESNSWSTPNTVVSQSSSGLCGPGGATALEESDGSTRLAFHAYKSNTPSSHVRQTWIGTLTWSTGRPVLH